MGDAFIAGISSILIWQRLLKNRPLTFQRACHQAIEHENLAYNSSETFQGATSCKIAASDRSKKKPSRVEEDHAIATSNEQSYSFAKMMCFLCKPTVIIKET